MSTTNTNTLNVVDTFSNLNVSAKRARNPFDKWVHKKPKRKRNNRIVFWNC